MPRETDFSAEGLLQVRTPRFKGERMPVCGAAWHSHVSRRSSEDSLFWNPGIGFPGGPEMCSMALSPLHLCFLMVCRC